jgi:exonuclease VII small subunit
MAKRKSVAKCSAVVKSLESSMASLDGALAASEKAVAARSKDAKKLTSVVKRLSKKRTTLSKRKRLATARLKKSPGGDTRTALRSVVKDLTATTKELVRSRTAKAANAEELTPLKAAFRRASAYSTAIGKIDRVLSKPKKKRRRRA